MTSHPFHPPPPLDVLYEVGNGRQRQYAALSHALFIAAEQPRLLEGYPGIQDAIIYVQLLVRVSLCSPQLRPLISSGYSAQPELFPSPCQLLIQVRCQLATETPQTSPMHHLHYY